MTLSLSQHDSRGLSRSGRSGPPRRPVPARRRQHGRAWLLHGLTLLAAAIAMGVLPWQVVLRQVLVAPWLEETVFRLGLQDALRRSRWWAVRRHANGLTALTFGIAHFVMAPPSLPAALALATAIPAWWIGRDYQRHRSLLRCVTWHACFNAAWLVGTSLLITS